MRYIKKFNENKSLLLDLDKLKDFCELHLVYLIDDYFTLEYHWITLPAKYPPTSLRNSSESEVVILSLKKETFDDDISFEWSDIENHFISFLKHLNNSYDIVDQVISWGPIEFLVRKNPTGSAQHISVSLIDILNGNIPGIIKSSQLFRISLGISREFSEEERAIQRIKYMR